MKEVHKAAECRNLACSEGASSCVREAVLELGSDGEEG